MRAFVGGGLIGFALCYCIGKTLTGWHLVILFIMGGLFTLSHYLWVRSAAVNLRNTVADIERARRRGYVGVDRRGFSLLELMVVCLIITIVMCIAVPNVAQVQAGMNSHNAATQVRTVGQTIAAYNICTATEGGSCPQLQAQIPPSGSIVQSGYTFTYSPSDKWGGWQYTARPLYGSGTTYFVNQTGVVRCGWNGAAANWMSAPC